MYVITIVGVATTMIQKNTNYISIVTSDDWYWGINKNERIQAVFDGLEKILSVKIQEG